MQVPNLAVEGLRQLVDNYERWFIANGSSQEAAWDTIINHVAYSLQYPPRFRWYFHVTGLVQARHVSFYRLQGPEGGLDRDVPAEERVASGQNDSDDFEISPLPGVVDVATLQACDKAGNELDVILNAYMLNPNSKRMEVKLRNVVRQ